MSQALERLVRPIYDALDNGSPKSALVACNKVLKKHPNNELVKALKALALIRSQKVEESLNVCDEVLAGKPTDEAVLGAMQHVLRGLGRHTDAVTMYEEAWKKDPGNEELGAQAFLANIRAGHWKAAQQARQLATKLSKVFKREHYLYWSVMSAVLQANASSTPENMRKLLYQLAHRLISSSPTPSFQHAERFHLHLTILRELGLQDDALKLLGNEIGQYICLTSLSCNEIRREILSDKGLTVEEGSRAEKLIEGGDRNWLEFVAVLEAVFAPRPEEESFSTADEVARVRQLLEEVTTKDGSSDRSGPLALLDLEKRCRTHNFATGRMIALLKEYFEKIGSKACCYEDLVPYVQLEGEELSEWTAYLQGLASSYSPLEDLQRLINCHKLLRYNLSSDAITVESETALASTYSQQYLEALPLGKGLPDTELQPADDLAILSGHAFVNLWTLTKDETYLWNAVSILEYGVSRSRPSYRMRLMLIRIYRLLGAPQLALEHYRLMQIKQVQHDTLSHFALSRSAPFSLASTGDLTYMSEHIEASNIYVTNITDTSEYTVRAFTQEKYSQIPEFIKFENQVECSLQRNIAKMEYLRMRLGFDVVSAEVVDMELIDFKFIFDRDHFDNRDFNPLPNYQPRQSPTLNEQTLLFGKSENLGWLMSFMKIYVRALQDASDLDDSVEDKLLIGDRPQPTKPHERPLKERLCERTEEEMADLTDFELSYVHYADALANWLGPHHDHVRPHPSVVLAEAAKLSEAKTGQKFKGIDIPPPPANGNGKKEEDAPPVTEPPSELLAFFDEMHARFGKLRDAHAITEALAIAQIMQEAFVLFMCQTLRFKQNSVVKIHKLGNLVASFKPVKAKMVEVLKEVGTDLGRMSEKEGNAPRRKEFIDGCKHLDHDFILNVAKRFSDARHDMLAGYGKGIPRILGLYPN
ncbi:actin cytoskeleton organization protein [Cylindrobasidium torrendii FP15055 ss-10]|uniref:Actin cytoskeleton organization protein n=1 Tax=Cylindrobasidium torrendii FP15055 ss-10 TaxID=1314674 RepID=A0A0D7BNT4_9AGAR|nr:actin cytoskeleton organization protein [Cylindrobasidium torrendii FP15055 ss-10]